MKRKKNNSKAPWKQLDLPFDAYTPIETKAKTSEDNIICLALKINERSNNTENSTRKNSINRLINYAEKLKW